MPDHGNNNDGDRKGKHNSKKVRKEISTIDKGGLYNFIGNRDVEVSEKKRLELNPKTRLNLQSPLNKEGLGGRLKEIKSMISESAIKKGGY